MTAESFSFRILNTRNMYIIFTSREEFLRRHFKITVLYSGYVYTHSKYNWEIADAREQEETNILCKRDKLRA